MELRDPRARGMIAGPRMTRCSKGNQCAGFDMHLPSTPALASCGLEAALECSEFTDCFEHVFGSGVLTAFDDLRRRTVSLERIMA